MVTNNNDVTESPPKGTSIYINRKAPNCGHIARGANGRQAPTKGEQGDMRGGTGDMAFLKVPEKRRKMAKCNAQVTVLPFSQKIHEFGAKKGEISFEKICEKSEM